MYKAIGKRIINVSNGGTAYEEQFDVAICDEPEKAIRLMDRAHYLNDVKRQYTASARLFYKAECLPGFAWTWTDTK